MNDRISGDSGPPRPSRAATAASSAVSTTGRALVASAARCTAVVCVDAWRRPAARGHVGHAHHLIRDPIGFLLEVVLRVAHGQLRLQDPEQACVAELLCQRGLRRRGRLRTCLRCGLRRMFLARLHVARSEGLRPSGLPYATSLAGPLLPLRACGSLTVLDSRRPISPIGFAPSDYPLTPGMTCLRHLPGARPLLPVIDLTPRSHRSPRAAASCRSCRLPRRAQSHRRRWRCSRAPERHQVPPCWRATRRRRIPRPGGR